MKLISQYSPRYVVPCLGMPAGPHFHVSQKSKKSQQSMMIEPGICSLNAFPGPMNLPIASEYSYISKVVLWILVTEVARSQQEINSSPNSHY